MGQNAKRYMDPHHWFGSEAEVSPDNKQPIPSEARRRDTEASMDAGIYEWFIPKIDLSVIQTRANDALEFFGTASQTVKKYMNPHYWFGSKLEESSSSRQSSHVPKRVDEGFELPKISLAQVKHFMDPHHWFGSIAGPSKMLEKRIVGFSWGAPVGWGLGSIAYHMMPF